MTLATLKTIIETIENLEGAEDVKILEYTGRDGIPSYNSDVHIYAENIEGKIALIIA